MSGNLLSRAVARLLLSAPVRRRASGTLAQDVLASLAERTGRTDLLPELAAPTGEPVPPPAPAVAALFDDAKRQAEQGRSMASAARTLEKALNKAPDDVACLILAVMIFTLSGNRTRAEFFGRRAVSLAPRVTAAHINLGNCLRDQQKYEEALACYKAALDLAPGMIQTLFNLAQCLSQLNRLDEADEFYLRTLASPAATLAEKTCHASALLRLDRLDQAEALLDRILQEAPAHGQALIDLASVYRRTRRHARAEELLNRVRDAQPSNQLVHVNLSGLYNEMHRYAEGLEAARKAYAINPREPGCITAMASSLSALGELGEAERYAREAMAVRRGRPVGILAVILEQQGRFDEAIGILRQIMAEDPEKGWAHFTLALSLLRRGKFEEGWRELEWRWKWEQNLEVPRGQHRPQWSKTARKGSTVLVWTEQGLGDSLQCLRFVPKLLEAGFKPVVEIQKPLLSLARQTLACPVVAQDDPLPDFDYQIPFMSLPFAFNTAEGNIPATNAYLKADKAATEVWRDRLAPDGRLLVGVTWAGNPRHGRDRFRSIPLERLTPLLELDDVRFVSLQRDLREGDEAVLAKLGGTLETQWIGECEDFAQTAALMSNLDLVIGVDSAVIHAAGGLGVATWLLLPFCPDWRWLTGREDSVWYDSLRLFRQSAHGDWQTPIDFVVDKMRRLAAERVIANS